MRYRSKPTECEAMQWEVPYNNPESGLYDHADRAEAIVAWVEANGGEAFMTDGPLGPKIAVRTINGDAYAAPGHYVVMGTARFCPHAEYGQPGHVCDGIVDFYPCDPETFERRWEAGSQPVVPVLCGRTEDHLAHGIPMTVQCAGVGEQVCRPEEYQHLGPWESVPPYSDVQRCQACGTEIGK